MSRSLFVGHLPQAVVTGARGPKVASERFEYHFLILPLQNLKSDTSAQNWKNVTDMKEIVNRLEGLGNKCGKTCTFDKLSSCVGKF